MRLYITCSLYFLTSGSSLFLFECQRGWGYGSMHQTLANKYLSVCRLFPEVVLQSINLQVPLKVSFQDTEATMQSPDSVKKVRKHG